MTAVVGDGFIPVSEISEAEPYPFAQIRNALDISEKVLTTPEGAKEAYNVAIKAAEVVSQFPEVEGCFGVAFPFYLRGADGNFNGAAKVDEYAEFHQLQRSKADKQKAQTPEGWWCTACEIFNKARVENVRAFCGTCEVNKVFNPKELFRTLADVDLFIVVPDEKITPEFLLTLGGKLYENGLRTWDDDFEEKIEGFVKREIPAFLDLHVIPESVLQGTLNGVRNKDLLFEDRVYSWRGNGTWDSERKYRLSYDFLISATPVLSDHFCRNEEIFSQVLDDVQTEADAEQLLDYIVNNMKNSPNTKEYRMFNNPNTRDVLIQAMLARARIFSNEG